MNSSGATTLHSDKRIVAVIVALHMALTALANYAAFLLRFDGSIPVEYLQPFFAGLLVLVPLRSVTFWAFKLNEGLWRYVSLWDLQNIIAASAVSTLAFAAAARYLPLLQPYPRTVFVIDTLVLVGLMGTARVARRVYREFDTTPDAKRILVFGAGDAGEMIVREMKNNSWYRAVAIGFVDDDAGKVGRSIHGVPVLGGRADLPGIFAERHIDEVLVAIPSAEPLQIRGIVRALEPFKVPIKTLPNLRDILDGRVTVSSIRSLSLEDLMTRPPVGLQPDAVRKMIHGCRVLVTGAGGSIGSELARQIAAFGPARLYLLDQYENSLFNLCLDLDTRFSDCIYEPLIGDIADEQRIDAIFADRLPEIIFHAAAHKHVPLMERNRSEAVKNNVRGTRVVAEAAARHGATEFVLISTDKAVNPSSVMGATKRVAELVVRSLAARSQTRFMAVRFGNVLGSNGSVSHTFVAQVARGGPVTVTHPEIRRFLMLIPEAVQLVLHAATVQESGAILVLEMGEQVRIQDLARNIIRLSGFVPDEEIAIRFTGLRAGEKLSEELIEPGEQAEPTPVGPVVQVRSTPIPADFAEQVARLERAAAEGNDQQAVQILASLVPTFTAAM